MAVDSPLVTPSPVLVIGTGLLGTSIALRLRRAGIDVHLQDASPIAAGLARDLGAGTVDPVEDPKLVVVAVPPDVTGPIVVDALAAYPNAVVTDVASVKKPVEIAVAGKPGAERWVGSHPMAGKERSGAIAADADLFMGRPWVIVAGPETSEKAVSVVRLLAVDMGASLTTMTAAEHDHAVAVVSHVPQIMSSIVGASLRSAPSAALDLAGQGLRDVTRIAHSDPLLWTSIIWGNRTEIASVLRPINARITRLIGALDGASGLDQVSGTIADGNDGVGRIPGKHGGAPARYAEVTVLVPDEPGELGRLFTEVGEIGVNIEDLVLEHSAQQPVGRAALSVAPSVAAELVEALEARGWQVVSQSGSKEERMALVVAIDGPSGSGKSTVSRRVAGDLGLAYLDTGAMYRAATWWALHEGIDLDDAEAVLDATRTMPLSIHFDPQDQRFGCAGEDITTAIRASELAAVVSKVATNLGVRAELTSRMQAIISNESIPGGFSNGRGIVVEGRDITTKVAPDADVRVLLIASPEARLARRALEVLGTADEEAIEATRDVVLRRDRDDSTVSEFMTAQDGVTTIDSSALSIDEVVDAVKSLIDGVSR